MLHRGFEEAPTCVFFSSQLSQHIPRLEGGRYSKLLELGYVYVCGGGCIEEKTDVSLCHIPS